MRYFVLSLSFLLLACSGPASDAGSGDQNTAQGTSVTALADQLIADGQDLSSLLETVTDEASARAIEPQLEAMIQDYQALSARFETMEEPTMTQIAALMSKAPRIAAAQEGVMLQIQRIYKDHPEASDILREKLESMAP